MNAEDMINQNIQEKTYTVSIQFNNPTLDKSVVVAPYNPFIKVFNSATEVHLTDRSAGRKRNTADKRKGYGQYGDRQVVQQRNGGRKAAPSSA